jgi:hypothetical protein
LAPLETSNLQAAGARTPIGFKELAENGRLQQKQEEIIGHEFGSSD